MAWRGLHLSEPCRLALADGQCVVAREDGEVRLALEDIAWIILDTPQATLTTALLASCMEAGIALIVTDARHHPSGLALPFHRHHRQAEIAALQVALGAGRRRRLWQALARAKLRNQAAVLALCGDRRGAARRRSAPWLCASRRVIRTISRRGRRGITGRACSRISCAKTPPIAATRC